MDKLRQLKNDPIKLILVFFTIFVIATTISFGVFAVRSLAGRLAAADETAQNQSTSMEAALERGLYTAQYSLVGLLNEQKMLAVQSIGAHTDMVTAQQRRTDAIQELSRIIGSSEVLGPTLVYFRQNQQMVESSDFNLTVNQKLVDKLKNDGKSAEWLVAPSGQLMYASYAPQPWQDQRGVYSYMVLGSLRSDFYVNLVESEQKSPGFKTFILLHGKQMVTDGTVPDAIAHFASNLAKSGSGVVRVNGHINRVAVVKNERSDSLVVTYYDQAGVVQSLFKYGLVIGLVFVALLALIIGIVRLFYAKIYRNMQTMSHYFNAAKRGDYSQQIPATSDPEFSAVFEQYNRMMKETDDLVHRLKVETNLRQDAEFRQLQAQISPHFLYNNLLFMVSMADRSPRAVRMMASHLSDYYHYVTLKTTADVTLKQELTFSENYLTIMALRKNLDFAVDYPEELANQPFMQVILQPIIENAIGHGIEGRLGSHEVNVQVTMAGSGYRVSVENDGADLFEEDIQKLLVRINRQQQSQTGSVGLWNVQHRLVNRYGQGSGLHFEPRAGHGLIVWFWVPLAKEEHDAGTIG